MADVVGLTANNEISPSQCLKLDWIQLVIVMRASEEDAVLVLVWRGLHNVTAFFRSANAPAGGSSALQ